MSAHVTSRARAISAIAMLAVFLGGCVVSVGGPDENREERFEFLPEVATRAEAVEAFRDLFSDDPAMLIEESVEPTGKISNGQGTMVFAEFEAILPDSGLNVCSGSAGPSGGGFGCRPANDPAPGDPAADQPQNPFPRDPLQNTVLGSSGTWSEAEFAVNEEVHHLLAVAEDGTTYRMEPLGSQAWMEWKTDRGDLVVTAYDAADNPLATLDIEAR